MSGTLENMQNLCVYERTLKNMRLMCSSNEVSFSKHFISCPNSSFDSFLPLMFLELRAPANTSFSSSNWSSDSSSSIRKLLLQESTIDRTEIVESAKNQTT